MIASGIGFGIPIFLTLIPYAYPESTVFNHPVFGASGTSESWCFYSSYDSSYRVWNHYLWIIICIGLNLVGYAFMITNIWYPQSQGGAGQEARNASLQKTIKKLIAYPIAFTALYLPICINRIMGLTLPSSAIPGQFTVAAVALMMCDGLVTSSLFLWRRQIIERYLALFGLLDWATFKSGTSHGTAANCSSIKPSAKPRTTLNNKCSSTVAVELV